MTLSVSAAPTAPSSFLDRVMIATLLVAALGYFVDVFDLILFSIVRVQSLKDIGVPESALLSEGVFILNCQMAGLLLGGFIWGVLADRWGRLSVLFASILTYSLANIANAFVHTPEHYALLRFIAGIGLAGELGVGVTLVSELLPRTLRGYGTTFIATIGVAGAVAASLTADWFNWRTAYIVGGVMGLMILVLRVRMRESALFKKIEDASVSRGNLMTILRQSALLKKYAAVVLIGAPTWFVVGILITFAPEFGKAFGMVDIPKTGTAVLYAYIGLVLGDLGSGLLSQYLRSRKKAVLFFLVLVTAMVCLHLSLQHKDLFTFYAFCGVVGFSCGYWAMFVQIAAEQFGTNLRATSATSVPNVVRGLTIPMTIAFQGLIPAVGVVTAGMIVGTAVILSAILALGTLAETFDRDLDFVE